MIMVLTGRTGNILTFDLYIAMLWWTLSCHVSNFGLTCDLEIRVVFVVQVGDLPGGDGGPVGAHGVFLRGDHAYNEVLRYPTRKTASHRVMHKWEKLISKHEDVVKPLEIASYLCSKE